jgi:hypothetical protein
MGQIIVTRCLFPMGGRLCPPVLATCAVILSAAAARGPPTALACCSPGSTTSAGITPLDIRPLAVKDIAARLTAVAATQVNVGPLTLKVQADPARGQALVTAAFAEAAVETQVLTITSPTLTLDVAEGAASAKGDLQLVLNSPPKYSAVTADVVATNAGVQTPFRGALGRWVATAEPVAGEYTTIINGELTADTTVRGAAGNIVQFSFVSGSLTIGSVTATQFAPRQVFLNDIVAGDLKIQAGATITLTFPTTIRPGLLLLRATVSTDTTPPTPIAASVARWRLPGQALDRPVRHPAASPSRDRTTARTGSNGAR